MSWFQQMMQSGSCGAVHLRDLNWTPDVEEILVPGVMAEACRGCPVRDACLGWATSNQEWGYWAGTTRADRSQLAAAGYVTVAEADRLQAQHLADDVAVRLHGDEPPSMRWYRAGCGCLGCRRCNRDRAAKAREARLRAS